MEQTPGLPDQVFVCNSGLVYNNKVYLSRFRHKERTGEQVHYLKWFKSQGLQTLGEDYPEFFEGGGDAVFSDPKTLWAGFGQRSGQRGIRTNQGLGEFDIVICELIHPNFYHLDTCFAPVDETTALWYPPAFSENTKKEVRLARYRSIISERVGVRNRAIVPRDVLPTLSHFVLRSLEGKLYIHIHGPWSLPYGRLCGVYRIPLPFPIRKQILLSAMRLLYGIRYCLQLACKKRHEKLLARRKKAVTDIDMSEFMKSGGACQCLVLRL
ncbi:Amidinotransferase [Cooperia oncophora]